jgi:hypothetical protein
MIDERQLAFGREKPLLAWHARDALAARYGVPVRASEAVPGWLTENALQQGPSGDDQGVDLSALTQKLIAGRD